MVIVSKCDGVISKDSGVTVHNYMYGLIVYTYGNPLPFEILRGFDITRWPPAANNIRNTNTFA